MPGPALKPLSLPRRRRIKQGRDFARIKAAGQRRTSGCLAVNWLPLPPGSPSRVGVITSRRLGNAVRRARARRLLREVFRRHQHALTKPLDLVLVARDSIAHKGFDQVQADFLNALRRNGLISEPSGSNA